MLTNDEMAEERDYLFGEYAYRPMKFNGLNSNPLDQQIRLILEKERITVPVIKIDNNGKYLLGCEVKHCEMRNGKAEVKT